MDIDGICHSAFCGRLEARFPGRAILYTTCPGLGLAKPDKSRLFSLLTVHSRPPFPFTFCFLPPVNSGGTAGAVFCPVGFGGRTTPPQTSQRFKSLSRKISASSVRPAARPPSGTTYSRPRKKSSADRCRCPHRQGQCSCRPHSNSTPGVSGWPPVFSAPGSCGKGNRPACVPAAASLYRGYLSCVPSILLSVAVLPEKVSCPIPAACSGVGTLPATSGHFVPKSDSLRCFPSLGIPFRTVILFSRCRPSMNYPKSTRKKCNSRNIARIAF